MNRETKTSDFNKIGIEKGKVDIIGKKEDDAECTESVSPFTAENNNP